MTQAGHRWRHRPDRTSSLRYVCQRCWSVIVGWTGVGPPPRDLRLTGPMSVPGDQRYSCEELLVLHMHER